MKMDEIVKTYIQVREKKSQLKAAFEEEQAKYTALQDKLEALILAKFQEMGIESTRTDYGTATATTRSSVSLADPDAFFQFVKENDAFDMIERRPAKAAVEQYKQATGDLPPGLNWSETRVVSIRRPTATHS
ncbi:MAG: hypothetical protein HXX17_08155 [Geobacteraceae bacterium]|nr:hypothetical protein [Geobacteraceae bacterium]